MSVTLDVATRYSFADGHEFGDTGAYEYLAGRARFAVDPKAPDLRAVVDLNHAPVNKDGKVEFAADFALLKPVDLKRGNKRLFFDYGNRGNKRCLQFFNDAIGAASPRTQSAVARVPDAACRRSAGVRGKASSDTAVRHAGG